MDYITTPAAPSSQQDMLILPYMASFLGLFGAWVGLVAFGKIFSKTAMYIDIARLMVSHSQCHNEYCFSTFILLIHHIIIKQVNIHQVR